MKLKFKIDYGDRSAGNAGNALLTTIMISAAIGVLVMILAQMGKNYADVARQTEVALDFEDLRRYLDVVIDCKLTLEGGLNTCTVDQNVIIRRSAPTGTSTTIIDNQPLANRTKIGKYYLLAKCTGPSEFKVFASRLKDELGESIHKLPFNKCTP